MDDRIQDEIKGLIQNVKKVWNQQKLEKSSVKVYEENISSLINQISQFFASGSYYHFVFNLETLKVEHVSDSVEQLLGISKEKVTTEVILSHYHPDDLEQMQVMELGTLEFFLKKIKAEDIPHYKSMYTFRYQFKDGTVKTILHQVKAISISETGKILKSFIVHTDISHLNPKIDQTISFLSDTLPSYYSLNPSTLEYDEINHRKKFTTQEIRIIELMAKGLSSLEIGEKLFISMHTVKTHKKNIMRKAEVKNSNELIANCIRKGVIM